MPVYWITAVCLGGLSRQPKSSEFRRPKLPQWPWYQCHSECQGIPMQVARQMGTAQARSWALGGRWSLAGGYCTSLQELAGPSWRDGRRGESAGELAYGGQKLHDVPLRVWGGTSGRSHRRAAGSPAWSPTGRHSTQNSIDASWNGNATRLQYVVASKSGPGAYWCQY